MPTTWLRAPSVTLALFGAACSAPESGAAAGTEECGIYGGSGSPYLQLTEEQQEGIVEITFNDRPEAACSGVAVGADWVLTAGHCVDGTSMEVRSHALDGSVSAIPVNTAVPHLSADVALLRLESPMQGSSLPLISTSIDATWIGAMTQLAGFGQTEAGTTGSRIFVAEQIVELTLTHLIVDGAGLSGACLGDSGGPVLGRADDGAISVLGVLDDGSATCNGRDRYTRVDVLLEWIVSVASEPDEHVASCDSLPPDGECFRGKAFYCDGDLVTVEDCGGISCGWSLPHGRFACVDPNDDPCAGTDALGYCDADVAVRCNRGVMERISCGECGATCVRAPTTARAGCGIML